MSDESEVAVQTIYEQQEKLWSIAQKLSNDGDIIAARERLKRWKERAVRLLRERVSDVEADALEKKEPTSLVHGQSRQNLLGEVRLYHGLLKTLAEAIVEDPSLVAPAPRPPAHGPAAEAFRGETAAPPPGEFPEAAAGPGAVSAEEGRNVFVVHGRNLTLRDALFRFLRSIGLRPLEWSQAVAETGKASPYIGEILDVAFSKAQAVVVLMTPDDEARLREEFRATEDPAYERELTGQARPNVLFEAGMAMGRSPERTVIVEIGHVRPFSDIAGRLVVRLSNDTKSRQQFAQRLSTARCPVDLSGTDWHVEGNFEL